MVHALLHYTTAVLSLALLGTASSTCERVITVFGKHDQDESQRSSQNNGQYTSLLYALNQLQSNDCVDIVSTPASLHEIIMLRNINGVTIRGWDNTIVMCNNTDGIHCLNCNNIVIEGITWDQCGDPQKKTVKGGIFFNNGSNLVIKSCTFQYSKVRTLSLVTISGFVYIINSYFVSNADNDAITCFTGPNGYKHCTTINYTSTGGVLIKSTTKDGKNTDIHIDSCVFNANGHFGNVKDSNITSSIISPEISYGAGLSIKVLEPEILVNVTIRNASFSSNRGSSGARAYIRIAGTNPNVILTGLKFYNNSVVKFYDNASALRVFYGNYNNSKQSLFSMSFCDFFDNHGGRNMVSYVVVGEPSLVSVSHCTFLNNWDFGTALVELNMRSNSILSISSLNFSANTGRGVIVYLHMHSINISALLLNINIVKNIASSVYKRRGMIFIFISHDNSTIRFSRVNATNNYFCSNGGGIYIFGTFPMTCQLYFQDSYFKNNVGFGSGSVIYSSLTCKIDTTYFISIVNSTFINNKGKSIVYFAMEYYLYPAFLVLNGIFENNTGTSLELFNTVLVGNGTTRFYRNKADAAAALCLSNSYILLNYSTFQFDISDNFANSYGGGIYIDFSLSNKDRSQCHWLLSPYDGFCRKKTYRYNNNCTMAIDAKLFCDLFATTKFALSSINIANNTALLAGSAIFYSDILNLHSVHTSISSSDPLSIFHISDVFIIAPNVDEPLVLATQPQRLLLADPAKCNSDYTACNITGLTLGENIEIPANIIGYNDKPSEATKFFIDCIENCVEFSITGGPIVLVSNKLSGISVIGQNVKYKASIKLRLYSGMINLNLSVGVCPCKLGYTYNQTAKQCHCYTVDNIVSCAVNTAIKKNYWFGMVDGKATISLCPSKHCNLSRTEIGISKYLLLPFTDDQCGLHRIGQACGNCKYGYTLAFDYNDCISVNNCSPAITVVIVISVMLYWVVVIVIVLWLMYFQINVGYLYGIIYYYSIVDILLGPIINYSGGFDVTEIMISSIVKLNPRFLGKLCFMQASMSGID